MDRECAFAGVAGAGVEAIHVLRHEDEPVTERALQRYERDVRGVGAGRAADGATVQVPGPHFVGRPLEHLVRGHLLRPVIGASHTPVALLAAKRRDA